MTEEQLRALKIVLSTYYTISGSGDWTTELVILAVQRLVADGISTIESLSNEVRVVNSVPFYPALLAHAIKGRILIGTKGQRKGNK